MNTQLCRGNAVPRVSDLRTVRNADPDVKQHCVPPPAPSIWREVAHMPLADWGRAAMLLVMLAIVCAAFYAAGESSAVGHVATATGGAR